MNKKTITDIDVKGKKCLVRVDFNVPMKDGVITDENRIIGALPTIKYLMEHGAKVVLCSHMGKPHNVFDDKIKLNKKEKAKIEAFCVSTPAKKAGTKTSARLLPNTRTFTSTTLSVRRTVRTRRPPLSSNTVL